MKRTADDVKFSSTETVFNDALLHCKDWLKVMTGINESAAVLSTIAQTATGDRSHAKAFVDIVGMANKQSDLYTAVKTLFDTISAYSKLAKSSSIAQQVLEYVFTNVATYGGMEKLKTHLAQLVSDRDRLMLEFNIGLPGNTEKLVELTVTKNSGKSPYSVKRAELLTDTIDLMKEYVADAGRSYKTAVDNIINLTNFVSMVNEYASLKKPDDRDRVEQQMAQNPLWEKFKEVVTFPAATEEYEYNLNVKDPQMSKVVGFVLEASLRVKAAMKESEEILSLVDATLEDLLSGLTEVTTTMLTSAELDAEEDVEGDYEGEFALAAMKARSKDMSGMATTEEILKARKILENAGVAEEIVFMLELPEEVNERLQVAAVKQLIKIYSRSFEVSASSSREDLKSRFLKDLGVVVDSKKLAVLASMPVSKLFTDMLVPESFIKNNL